MNQIIIVHFRKKWYETFMKKILIPSNKAESEFIEKRSRFISIVLPVEGADEIKGIIKETRKAHPQSRHVVWAYILGDSRSVFGLSDDGEPHGTAGRPVLEVLKGSGLTDALILVIRYFGGIKLGTGGLVQAYTRSAQDVLDKVVPLEKIEKKDFYLNCSYHLYEQIKKAVQSEAGEVVKEVFGADVKMEIQVPDERAGKCAESVRNISAGTVTLNEFE